MNIGLIAHDSKKILMQNLSFADFETEGVNFSFFRYADVLLMYAEARIKAAELGGDPIDDTVSPCNDVGKERMPAHGFTMSQYLSEYLFVFFFGEISHNLQNFFLSFGFLRIP